MVRTVTPFGLGARTVSASPEPSDRFSGQLSEVRRTDVTPLPNNARGW